MPYHEAYRSSIEMTKMLVYTYLTVGFVREIATNAGVKDIDEGYTFALLHNLGEIAVAYFLPEKYSIMRHGIDACAGGHG